MTTRLSYATGLENLPRCVQRDCKVLIRLLRVFEKVIKCKQELKLATELGCVLATSYWAQDDHNESRINPPFEAFPKRCLHHQLWQRYPSRPSLASLTGWDTKSGYANNRHAEKLLRRVPARQHHHHRHRCISIAGVQAIGVLSAPDHPAIDPIHLSHHNRRQCILAAILPAVLLAYRDLRLSVRLRPRLLDLIALRFTLLAFHAAVQALAARFW